MGDLAEVMCQRFVGVDTDHGSKQAADIFDEWQAGKSAVLIFQQQVVGGE